MMLHVVDRTRWRRTKAFGAFALWCVALACAGGLESEPETPIPSVGGFFVAMGFCVLIAINIAREEK